MVLLMNYGTIKGEQMDNTKVLYEHAYRACRVLKNTSNQPSLQFHESHEMLAWMPQEISKPAWKTLKSRDSEFTGWVNTQRRLDWLEMRLQRESLDNIYVLSLEIDYLWRYHLQGKSALTPCKNCGEPTTTGRDYHGLAQAIRLCRACQIELEV